MILSDIAGKYPEAPVIVAMAESTWAGNRKAAKIEFSLSDRGYNLMENEALKSPAGCPMFGEIP